ncbi:MAG: hypothetical protein CFH01_01357 [Alphaproteobacteria bacterium MarineAlpha2_Bin1]|nr:MAG: hypothetical protein CFH01_01357 [Alphaproteobacteria bacterium MarineAlpha2_Bin1]|tara:strand:+ start:2888 stop:3892 length:1005 start_codon:yes stop_codon:yes gene_type:complete
MVKIIKKLKNKKNIYLFSILLLILLIILYLSTAFFNFDKSDKKNLLNNQKVEKSKVIKKYDELKTSEKKLIIERYIKHKNKVKSSNNSELQNKYENKLSNSNIKKPSNITSSIVIIIDDAGMNISKLKDLLNLKLKNITIAFLPYSNNLDYQVNLVNESGYDILVHIPMEPEDISIDPGPNALLTSHNIDELKSNIYKNLSKFSNYVGINNHMGSKFTSNSKSIKNFFEIIKSMDLIFVDSKTSSNSLAAEMSNKYNIPTLSRDLFIDNVHDKNYVLMQLRKAEKIAKEKGHVVVIGHLQKWTIDALAEWYPSAKNNGLILDTVSSIIKKKLVN